MPLSWIAKGAASAERGRRLMALRGVTPNGHPLWQSWEVQPLVQMHPAYGSIFPVLDRRTHPAVYSKAGRLGIATKRPLPWSENEIVRLRKVYPRGTREDILTAFPGRTYGAIAKAANERKIYREKRQPVPTGNRLLDQILERTRVLGYSRSDLDRMSLGAGYFARKKWKSKLDEGLHCRTVRAMGGRVRAAFQ